MTETVVDYVPGATIRRRKKDEAPLSDACCTPEWLARRLPIVDLDPASNPRSHVQSRWSYSLETKLDGLILPWRGSVFLNHPYSKPLPWMEKLYHELSIGRCTSAIVLAKLDSSVAWWKVLTRSIQRGYDVTETVLGVVDTIDRGRMKLAHGSVSQRWYAPDMWLLDKRIEFDQHPELIEKRRQEILAIKAAGKKAPPLETTNNFCSVIVHHRFDGEPLKIGDIAQLWKRG